MKKRLTLLAVLSLIGLWLATGVASAQEGKTKSETKTVTGIQVELTIPAEGLKVGENDVSVRMKEAASGQAVVRDLARMDVAMDEGDKSMNHGGMSMSNQKPALVELKPVASEQGRYEGKVTLTDPGDWNLRVFTDSRGVGSPATFKIRAEKRSPSGTTAGGSTTSPSAASQASGPNLPVLGGLALLVVVGVAGVAFVKKSSASSHTPTQETTKA